jgi:hypothetical protein
MFEGINKNQQIEEQKGGDKKSNGSAGIDCTSQFKSIHEAGPAKAPQKSTTKPLLDLARYRGANQPVAEGDSSSGTQTNIPVKKPGSKNFFRVHPDSSFHLYDVRVIEDEGGDVYLIEPGLELPDDVEPFVSRENLLTAISHRGKVFVWHFKNKDTSWAASALRVARRAQQEWIRIRADFETGGYNVFSAPEPLRDKIPVLPSMSAEEIFTLAFDNRRITSAEHPLVCRLRGLE